MIMVADSRGIAICEINYERDEGATTGMTNITVIRLRDGFNSLKTHEPHTKERVQFPEETLQFDHFSIRFLKLFTVTCFAMRITAEMIL